MHLKGDVVLLQKYKFLDVNENLTVSQLITRQIAELADWQGNFLASLRKLILVAAPGITEEWKWGSAVWSKKGNVLAASAFKDHVKLTFFKSASLPDPQGLFNAGLNAKASRSINFGERDKIQETALKELIRAAVACNLYEGIKKQP